MKNLSKIYFFLTSFVGSMMCIVCGIMLIHTSVDQWFIRKYYLSNMKEIAYAKEEGLVGECAITFHENFKYKIEQEYKKRSYKFYKFLCKNLITFIFSLLFTLVHLFYGFKKRSDDYRI